MNDQRQIAKIESLYKGVLAPIDGPGACAKAAALAVGQTLFILAYTPDFCGFVTPSDGGLIAGAFELRCFCADFELRWVREGEAERAVTLSEKEFDSLGRSSQAGEVAPLPGETKGRSLFSLFNWGRKGPGDGEAARHTSSQPLSPPLTHAGTGRAVILSEKELDGLEMSPLAGGFFKSKRPGQYILWGKGNEKGRLFEHRVGELPLPAGIEVPPKGRVCLNFIEYFHEDDYGNMAWHSERLTGVFVP